MKNLPKRIQAKTSPKHVEVEACILWCIDPRFRGAREKLLEVTGIKNPDLLLLAGGAKSLARKNSPEQEFVTTQLKKLAAAHHWKLLILTVHVDCAMYGGLKAFGGDTAKERKKLLADLKKSREALRGQLPADITIETALVDFHGIHNIA
jgi:hypothetical protein